MKFKTICTINTVVFSLTTLNFLFLPAFIFRLYSPVAGYEPGIDVIWTGRILAAFFAFTGLLSWLVRDAEPSPTRAAVATAYAGGHAFNAFIHVLVILNGAMNNYGWGVVVLMTLLAAGFWRQRGAG